jgi:DNA-binding GntR family transcriptional regulator
MTAMEKPIAFDVSWPPDGQGDGARTLASAIYARLRADVLSCRVQPGEKMLIGPLSRRFNVSVASVREALSRLVADGMVVAEDQRGFRVSPLSLADLADLTHSRIELECLALRRAIRLGDEAWRSALAQAWDALKSVPRTAPGDAGRHHEAWSLTHGRFHSALVAACGLEWLMRFRATLFDQSERYRRLALLLTGNRRDAQAEHARIFEATMARDAEAAAALLAEHFEHTTRSIEDAYRTQGHSSFTRQAAPSCA